MVYVVTKALEYYGKVFLPGQLIKLTPEDLKRFKGSVKTQLKVTKDFTGSINGESNNDN